jgi:large subunit ribosomal protein L17
LLLLLSFCCAEAGVTVAAPGAGMKWTMMRHGNKVKHLGRPADQRKALIRSLVTETLRHGQIRTTKVRTQQRKEI